MAFIAWVTLRWQHQRPEFTELALSYCLPSCGRAEDFLHRSAMGSMENWWMQALYLQDKQWIKKISMSILSHARWWFSSVACTVSCDLIGLTMLSYHTCNWGCMYIPCSMPRLLSLKRPAQDFPLEKKGILMVCQPILLNKACSSLCALVCEAVACLQRLLAFEDATHTLIFSFFGRCFFGLLTSTARSTKSQA